MFSLSTGFEYFSRVLKTADVIVLLFILSIVIRSDWDGFCLSPDPPRPVLVRLSVIFSHQIFWPIFYGSGIVLLLFTAWLTPSGYPGSWLSDPQDSVQMWRHWGSGHWTLRDTRPGHPPPMMGQCGNIQNSSHPHLNSNLSQWRAVNKHHLNWIRIRHKDLL